MKVDFKKTLKYLKRHKNILLFFNGKIGKSVSESKRLSEESTDKYLGANYEIYDLIQHIKRVEERIEQTIK